MKKIICSAILALVFSQPLHVLAQKVSKEQILAEGELKESLDKKFHWGISLQNYLSSITGNQVERSYFYKPSIGFNFRAEYYFNSFLGIGVGAGYQQRGAGLKNSDVTGGAFAHPWVFVDTPEGYRSGDPDSTYLERLRFNTVEFPVTLLLRTPKDVLQKGMKLSGAVGPTFVHLFSANQMFQSIVDGFHPYNWVQDNYTANQFGLQASVGFDIDSGAGSSMFQVHLVYTTTLSNIYAKGQGDGRNTTAGIRLAWLF
ncbi:MAG: PorT family protein [Cyclobacteriaceae bacterium]|nr:PorT family protein [Cyclobacteriaceae bacterium]